MASNIAARTKSAPIISGRRLWRSTHPPPIHARIAPGSVSATVSKPRSIAPAPATSIAAIGSAVRVTRDPTAETPCALHRYRNSRCPHSPPRGRTRPMRDLSGRSIDHSHVLRREPIAQAGEQRIVEVDAPCIGQLELAADPVIAILDDDGASAVLERRDELGE